MRRVTIAAHPCPPGGESACALAYRSMERRRADGGPGLMARVRWGNVGRLAALLAAALLILAGPRGCGRGEVPSPPGAGVIGAGPQRQQPPSPLPAATPPGTGAAPAAEPAKPKRRRLRRERVRVRPRRRAARAERRAASRRPARRFRTAPAPAPVLTPRATPLPPATPPTRATAPPASPAPAWRPPRPTPRQGEFGP